jgi:hypothetical protein
MGRALKKGLDRRGVFSMLGIRLPEEWATLRKELNRYV